MTTTLVNGAASAPVITHTRLPGADFGSGITGRYTSDSSRSSQRQLIERSEPLDYITPERLKKLQQRMLKRVLNEAGDGLSSWSLLFDLPEASCLWPGEEMQCPVCGGENLHQVAIVSPESSCNRITIAFLCESCPAEPHLHLAQHKGTNTIYWDAEMLLKDFGIYEDAVAQIER